MRSKPRTTADSAAARFFTTRFSSPCFRGVGATGPALASPNGRPFMPTPLSGILFDGAAVSVGGGRGIIADGARARLGSVVGDGWDRLLAAYGNRIRQVGRIVLTSTKLARRSRSSRKWHIFSGRG